MKPPLLCLLAICQMMAPLHAQGGLIEPTSVVAAEKWTEADYARFTPAAFRQHAPAQRVMDRTDLDHALLNAAIFFATNAERLKHKLPPFQASRPLTECAFEHSRDMALNGFFSHNNPKDVVRRSPFQRMELKGVTGGHRAENIAMRNAQGMTYLAYADAVLKMWMNSPGHRANILNRRLTFLGCGAHACRCAKFHLHATQNFASAVPGMVEGKASGAKSPEPGN